MAMNNSGSEFQEDPKTLEKCSYQVEFGPAGNSMYRVILFSDFIFKITGPGIQQNKGKINILAKVTLKYPIESQRGLDSGDNIGDLDQTKFSFRESKPFSVGSISALF